MRGLEGSAEEILYRLGHDAKEQVQRVWESFINFAARDNVLEVALGLIIANSFTTVVSSFVSDIILPIVSLLPFINRNLDQKFAVLSAGPNYIEGKGYNTVNQARDDGALVLAYGVFVENFISFAGISLTLYAVAQLYMYISHTKIIKPTVRCMYCKSFISDQVRIDLSFVDLLRAGIALRPLLELARWSRRFASVIIEMGIGGG